MKIYHIKQTQFIPADLETVWSFFSTPKNLDKITPQDMNFVMTHMSGSEKMYTGQLISYFVSPFPLLRLRWVTEIKHVADQKYFVDEQKFGPFALWYHQHFFTAKDGGVEMTDEVSYAIPFGILGRLANHLFVRQRVNYIFEFRRKRVEELFTR
jgi:ligand-binding SRPBCC domain-containing protein